MKAKSLKTLVFILGGAASFSGVALAASPGQLETGGESVPASRDTSGQISTPGQSSTMPGSGSGIGGSGPGAATTPGATTAPGPVTTPGGATPPTDPNTSQALTGMTDADILAVMTAIDSNEIKAANAAQKEKLGSKAKGYAKMLKKQHAANADKTGKLSKKTGITPSTANQTASDLRAKGESELTTLASLDGKEFEKAYIDAMVNGHTEALQVIDTQLLPSAKNEDVRTQIKAMRGHVAHHLEEGKRLQETQASKTE
jgi:putative membrane protein